MEQHTGWLPGSSASHSYCSAITYGCQWLSHKPYVDKILPAYVDQPSTLRGQFDVGMTGDRMGGQIVSRSERRRGSDSGCSISSPLVDDIQLSTFTDIVSTDADSTEVTVVADRDIDLPGELTATEHEKQSTVCRNDGEDFSDEVQPLGDSSLCSVCGDVAAGFHCGAYVCEACKVRTYHF